jgi:uncharacterized protein (TIGR03089 family)
MSTAAPAPTALLLDPLEALGPLPALAWHGEASRIELSGHVLANWVIKAIGHLHDEVALEQGDVVVLDLPPHWKRLVLALAVWSLGGEVVILPRSLSGGADAPEQDEAAGSVPAGVEDPRVVVTDRPGSALADSAEEVLAVQPLSLAPRYDGELPPLVRDWVLEVRGSSDRLSVPLPAWSGPVPVASAGSAPRLLVEADGLDVVPRLLGAWAAGGGVVGPASSVSDHRAAEEGVTARA